MAQAPQKPNLARRRFIADSGKAVSIVALLGFGLQPVINQAQAKSVNYIRPPGALPEADFSAACVRCGLCVQDCPYDTLSLAEYGQVAAAGTPVFEARKVPCEMCEDIPCVKACPTNALDKTLTNIDDAEMGTAVLIDQEHCLNFLGLRCDVCYRVCPVIDKAITLQMQRIGRSKHTVFLPVVHADHCTGCGKCEQSCVLDESAIVVLPRDVARVSSAEHYRVGWDEKQKRGKSFLPEVLDLPDRRPK